MPEPTTVSKKPTFEFVSESNWTYENFRGSGRNVQGFGCRSPVEAPRDRAFEFFEPEVIVDGVRYRLLGVERNMPAIPIYPGEMIGLAVEPIV